MTAAPNPITHDAKYRSQVLGARNDAMNKLKQEGIQCDLERDVWKPWLYVPSDPYLHITYEYT